MNNNTVEGNKIIISLDSKIYSKDGIVKCLYWYAHQFRLNILLEDNHYKIELTPKKDSEIQNSELEKYLNKLNQDFIDYNLRDIVTKETSTIRELLIAKAFSHGEYKEEPLGELEKK